MEKNRILVENGFSEIRTARERRVTAEAVSATDKEAVLMGKVSLQKENTIYNKFGDWLGTASLLISCRILFSAIKIKKRNL